MHRLFDDRERAAETAFVHEEELRFLAHRRAVQALAMWAARSMQLSAEAAHAYETRLVDDFIANTPDERLIAKVQTDLERAGKPAMTTQVGIVLSRANAEAVDALRGQPVKGPAPTADPLDTFEQRHGHRDAWGSLRF